MSSQRRLPALLDVKASRGGGVLMGCAAGRLELECGELDVEVTDEALLQLVEELRDVAVVEAAVVHDDVRGEHRQLWPRWRHEGRSGPLGRGRCEL